MLIPDTSSSRSPRDAVRMEGGRLRVVVLADPSRGVVAAVRCATVLAAQHKAPTLRLLYVARPGSPSPDDARVSRNLDEVFALSQRDAAGPVIVPEPVVRRAESVAEATLDEVERSDADLLVLDPRRRGWLDDTTAALVRHASADVLLVRDDATTRWPEQPARVVVGVDFSDPSRRALAMASRIGHGPVVATHVVRHRVGPGAGPGALVAPLAADPFLPGRVCDRLHTWAEPFIDEIRVVQGDVSERLIQVAMEESAGLVVLGARGLDGGRDHVPERVAAEASAPVLIVR